MPSIVRSARSTRLCMLVALLAGLCACDPGVGEGDARSSPNAAKPQPPKDPLADMVSAVSGSRVSAPVELKFALDQRPEVGQPVEVRIAVLPVSVLDRVAASFQAGAGLELRAGGQMSVVNKPEPGVPLAHRLTVVPQRDGIFFVSAVVLADSPEQSLARTFSIPIIAAKAPPKAQSGSAVPRKDPKKR